MEYTVVDPDLQRPSLEGRDLLRAIHSCITLGAEGSNSPHAALNGRADSETRGARFRSPRRGLEL